MTRMPPAAVFGAKRNAGLALLMLVFCAACVSRVSPSAAELATAVAEAGGRYEPVAGMLAARGFQPLTPGAFGGPQPEAAAGACLEKARGNAIYGVDVVRLCHDGANAVEGVYAMQTHSVRDWREVRVMP